MLLKIPFFSAAFTAVLFFFFSCDKGVDTSGDKGLIFTQLDQDAKTIAAETSVSFRVAVKNNDAALVSVVFVRTSIELPDSSWSSSLCAGGKCFPAFVDTVYTDIEAGRADTCDAAIQTGTAAGTARVAVRIYDKADSTRHFERTFSCSVVQ